MYWEWGYCQGCCFVIVVDFIPAIVGSITDAIDRTVLIAAATAATAATVSARRPGRAERLNWANCLAALIVAAIGRH